MSMRYDGGFITASYDGLKVPDAPVIGTAVQTISSTVSVPFTAPSNIGGSTITSYTVRSTPGCITSTATTSPITVSGLTNGTAYTFKVLATNSYGSSVCSSASNSVTPVSISQQAYTTAGTYTWVAPATVTSVSVVVIGGGGSGGGGGGLTYKNNQTVTPGNSYTVVVGAGGSNGNGGTSRFNTTILATGGAKNGGGGGGSGGTASYSGGAASSPCAGGGGGAAGYTANGCNGIDPYFNPYCCIGQQPGYGGNAGNAGNSGGYGGTGLYCWPARAGAGGGGQGIYGLGLGASYRGANGANGYQYNPGAGGAYGGGGGYGGGGCDAGGSRGAVRIIWPGTSRSFPSTCTGDK